MAKILIVDDAPVDRTIAGGLLKSVPNWHVVYATDGAEAMECVRADPPDLILTDLHMPKLDGFGLLSTIKESHPQIPVVLMTYYGGEELAIKAMEHGAASYVPKKAMGRTLRQTIQRVLMLSQEELTHHLLMQHATRIECFELDNNPAYIDVLANYFRRSLSELWDCQAAHTVRIGVAIAEALSNAIYHGNLELSSELRVADCERFYQLAVVRASEMPYAERKLRVTAEVSAHTAKYVIVDEGNGFDPAHLPDPTLTEWLDTPCGRGVLLMRSFMDEVHFGHRGNEVTLLKRRASSVATAAASELAAP
jgi:CheY-like chemotaxis protein/anti-sigma regulatory factor (Ser/Thr protein kinase)